MPAKYLLPLHFKHVLGGLVGILSQRGTSKTYVYIHYGSIYLTLEKISMRSDKDFKDYYLCIKEYFSTPKQFHEHKIKEIIELAKTK